MGTFFEPPPLVASAGDRILDLPPDLGLDSSAVGVPFCALALVPALWVSSTPSQSVPAGVPSSAPDLLTPALPPPPSSAPDLLTPALLPPQPSSARVSPSVRGLGPHLARKIRQSGPLSVQTFASRGLSKRVIEAAGGTVTAEIGPIIAGTMTGVAIHRLAPSADLIEAPQPLHPLLDVSRVAIHADQLDQGRDLPRRFRGKNVLIAAYDSGIDLLHPDLRGLDGPSRVIALWDQNMTGTPPAGHTIGNECTEATLQADACPSIDAAGHGTEVLSVAAGNAPKYRGIAPEASLAVARSDDFELFFEALAWFAEVARKKSLPLVVNLSIGGHIGPHDGTSLEAQAIDCYGSLVVAASGNEGSTPVHAFAVLLPDKIADVALRFPANADRRPQRATIDIWGEAGRAPVVQALVMRPGGAILAETATVSAGSPGRTTDLAISGTSIGRAHLDAEAGSNPFNGKSHLSVAFELPAWQDPPAGPGYVVARLRGEGRVDLWVDSPATQSSPVAFDKDNLLVLPTEVTADVSLSISDPATAVSAIAVAAYATRKDVPSERGRLMTSGAVGSLAPFSSYGPTLAPQRTGPKPDIAAPGYVVVAARSRSSPDQDPGFVSQLYRASAGTSLAAPHVAGTAALILSAKPNASRADLKLYILRSAARTKEVDQSRDPRWGAGQLDAVHAVESALGISEGCHCGAVERTHPSKIPAAAEILFLCILCGALRRPRA